VRAAARAREPFASRGHRDVRSARAARRALGVSPPGAASTPALEPRLPRVIGDHAAAIIDVLLRLGPAFFHGLSTIERRARAPGSRTLGRYTPPGRIELFDDAVDVLLHELGHHVTQHRRGARAGRIARTRDHEAAAELVARRARELLA
jgi:hypothetical protein